jgi:hypothetical protein
MRAQRLRRGPFAPTPPPRSAWLRQCPIDLWATSGPRKLVSRDNSLPNRETESHAG